MDVIHFYIDIGSIHQNIHSVILFYNLQNGSQVEN